MTRQAADPAGVRFAAPLVEGRLVRRYQRFLADVSLPDGSTVTAHCPNTGAMLGCQATGSRVWLSRATNPQRRCALTWELVETGNGVLVGINTSRTNQLVAGALRAGSIAGLPAFDSITAEVRVPEASVRFDFLLRRAGEPDYYLEVKNVTAAVEAGRALFPDAVSERAARHARELAKLCRQGARAGILFCVQRADVATVAPADDIDPAYGVALRAAAADGVDVLACGARVSPEEIIVDRRVDVVL